MNAHAFDVTVDGHALTGRWQESWLLLDGPSDGSSWHELPALSAALPAPLKFVLADDMTVRLRGEIPVESADELTEVLARFADGGRKGGKLPDAEELAAFVTSAGWPGAVKRNETTCAVPLDVDQPLTALLVACDDGVRASVTVGALGEDAPPECVRAVTLLMLTTGAVVRQVRPVLNGREAQFEVCLPAPIEAGQIAHALAALSVACRAAERESALLASDAALAADFLSLRGHTRPHASQTKTDNTKP